MRLLSELEVFVALAQTRHFGRAAAALDISAPTLSRRISALERELGVSLLTRSTRHVALSDAGQMYFELARPLIEEAEQIHDAIRGSAGAAAGHMRVGLPQDLGHTVFYPLVAEFVRSCPKVTLELVSISSDANPFTEALDVALRVQHQRAMPDSSHVSRRLGSFSRMLFASRRYLAQRGTPQEPRDLEGHACLCMSGPLLQRQWELRRERQRRVISVSGPCSANSVVLLSRLAAEHLGICILPKFLADQPAAGVGLVRVLPEWEAVPAHVFALTTSRLVPLRVTKFLDALKEKFAGRVQQMERSRRQLLGEEGPVGEALQRSSG